MKNTFLERSDIKLSKILGDFRTKFKIEELKIYETSYWVWSLRPHQVTLGSGILSLKRECATFSELEPDEYCDLNKIIKVIEPTLKELFKYDVINYLMLMMVDKQVHYHVIPRYENEMKLFGVSWKDTSWPGVPNLVGEIIEKEKAKDISLYIKQNIKEYK